MPDNKEQNYEIIGIQKDNYPEQNKSTYHLRDELEKLGIIPFWRDVEGRTDLGLLCITCENYNKAISQGIKFQLPLLYTRNKEERHVGLR